VNKIVILGAGISGISAGYHLKISGLKSIIYEKNKSWGGLCDNFEVKGFRFDRFVHLSFSDDDYVKKLFDSTCEQNVYIPDPINYYKGCWLKHPVQNNIYNLSVKEKIKIIKDFFRREFKPIEDISNLEEWLRIQFGDYFAENFPMRYTRKYWNCEAKGLETKWIGSRIYMPSIDEVLEGAMTEDTPHTYYAKEMRYPVYGGYKTFLSKMAEDLDIRLQKNIINIDTKNKILSFDDGSNDNYDEIISSIPLPEYINLIHNIPDDVKSAINNLKWTSGALVSLGFNKPHIAKNLWFYIYDEDILPARIYSPSMKSINNVPPDCSSMQAEIYIPWNKLNKINLNKLMDDTISSLINIDLFKYDDLIVKDIRIEKYANVIFNHDVYKNRNIIHDYLKNTGIKYIGRFGEWEYLWSDQSLISGKKCAENMTGQKYSIV